ncbi:MAG TPA: hypothetical protein VK447_08040, partial [Myxococcaceae bacterium]|nr:hypothetical protein [Myxococcaceae bacterium]
TLDQHPALHPLVVAVREVRSAPGDVPGSRRYRITDRMKLGPFAVRFNYAAVVSLDVASGTVSSEAFQFPAIHLRNTTRCRPEGTGTRLEEHVEIDAPGPLLRFVREQARRAHEHMLYALKELLEREEGEALARTA